MLYPYCSIYNFFIAIFFSSPAGQMQTRSLIVDPPAWQTVGSGATIVPAIVLLVHQSAIILYFKPTWDIRVGDILPQHELVFLVLFAEAVSEVEEAGGEKCQQESP